MSSFITTCNGSTSPHSGIKSHFSGPWFVLALARIRRLVNIIKALLPLSVKPLPSELGKFQKNKAWPQIQAQIFQPPQVVPIPSENPLKLYPFNPSDNPFKLYPFNLYPLCPFRLYPFNLFKLYPCPRVFRGRDMLSRPPYATVRRRDTKVNIRLLNAGWHWGVWVDLPTFRKVCCSYRVVVVDGKRGKRKWTCAYRACQRSARTSRGARSR